MKWEEFPHSGNVRGLHGSASYNHPEQKLDWIVDELKAMGIGWFKLLDNRRGSSIPLCKRLRAAGIEPIVRLYTHQQYPGSMMDIGTVRTVEALRDVGVVYVEIGNEPNQQVEWKDGYWRAGGRPELVMDDWIKDALHVSRLGVYPALPALAQCAHHGECGSIPWYEKALGYLATKSRNQMQELIERGLWIAVHNAVLNHAYQDSEEVWHFEYPGDPLNQKDHPGATAMFDDCSLMGWQVPDSLMLKYFGVHVPIISTEGGVFCPRSGWSQPDSRYPGYDEQGHARMTVAMFDYISRELPGYYFAMCPWLMANEVLGHTDRAWREDAWYRPGYCLPVVAAMKAQAPVLRAAAGSTVAQVEQAVRNGAWNQLGIALNPDAAFPRYARDNGWGRACTGEFDLEIAGKRYRAQGFDGGIVFAEVEKWDQLVPLSW